MSIVEQRQITIQPIISYPHEAQVGKSYIMTIDLQVTTSYQDWPFAEEEYPVWFILNTSPLFSYEPLDEENQTVILHRFGGTYGPATFLLTAAQQEMQGKISITLVNDWGIPIEEILIDSKIIAENGEQTGLPTVRYKTVSRLRKRVLDQEEPPKEEFAKKSPANEPPREDHLINRNQDSNTAAESAKAEYSAATSILTVFYSYHHKDEALRSKLAAHLTPLKRQGLIDEWYDHSISLGESKEEQLDVYLNKASIILLLISPNYFASDYCYSVEMKRAMERHEAGLARVIPIILRPVDWSDAPFAKLQALPTNGKPVIQWKNRDEAFLNVAQGIRRSIEDWRANSVKSQEAFEPL